MTKRFEEFLNRKPVQPKEEPIEVDGGFSCEVCYQMIDEPALWFRAAKILEMTCPNGHKTVIKDFKGF